MDQLLCSCVASQQVEDPKKEMAIQIDYELMTSDEIASPDGDSVTRFPVLSCEKEVVCVKNQ